MWQIDFCDNAVLWAVTIFPEHISQNPWTQGTFFKSLTLESESSPSEIASESVTSPSPWKVVLEFEHPDSSSLGIARAKGVMLTSQTFTPRLAQQISLASSLMDSNAVMTTCVLCQYLTKNNLLVFYKQPSGVHFVHSCLPVHQQSVRSKESGTE